MENIQDYHKRVTSILQKFRARREMGTLCDVIFLVGDRSFPAHKDFLVSQSSYFEAMFIGGFIEANAKEVRIKDVSATAFGVILNYLYGDKVDVRPHIESVMIACDMLCVDPLLKVCQDLVMENWRTWDATEVTSLSLLHFLLPDLLEMVNDLEECIRGDSNDDSVYESLDNNDKINADYSYFIVALERRPLQRPCLAFKFLENWLANDVGRMRFLPEILPLYPLLQIPYVDVKRMLDWATDNSDIGPALVEIYQDCCKRYKISYLKLVGYCNSENMLLFQTFDFDSFSWSSLSCTVPFSLNIQTHLAGNTLCVLDEDKLYTTSIVIPVQLLVHTIPYKSCQLICLYDKSLLVLKTTNAPRRSAKIVKIDLPSCSCTESSTLVGAIYATFTDKENGLVFIAGNENLDFIIEGHALYSYEIETGFSYLLTYLPAEVCALCNYKQQLVTIDTSEIFECLLHIHVWNITTDRIATSTITFSEEVSPGGLKILSAQFSKKREKLLILVAYVPAAFYYKHLMIVTSQAKESESGTLTFSTCEIEAFLPQEEGYNEFVCSMDL